MHWTRDQVLDQVDLPFLDDLYRAWKQWPPLRKFFAAYNGHKPSDDKPGDLAELVQMFPDGKIG